MGFDWKRSSILTLRHAAGKDSCVYSRSSCDPSSIITFNAAGPGPSTASAPSHPRRAQYPGQQREGRVTPWQSGFSTFDPTAAVAAPAPAPDAAPVAEDVSDDDGEAYVPSAGNDAQSWYDRMVAQLAARDASASTITAAAVTTVAAPAPTVAAAPIAATARAPLVPGARVDTSVALYAEHPLAIVAEMSKGYLTLVYPNGEKDPVRKCSWVRDNCTIYPRPDYAYVAFESDRWFVEDEDRNFYQMRRDVLDADVEDWLLTCAEANPSFFLPIEPRCFAKLQAKASTAPDVHEWTGFLPGGVGRRLPESFVRMCFSEDLINTCIQSGRLIDCTRVGAAASAKRKGAPSSAPVVDVPSSRFLSDGDDYCITFGAAAAVDLTGDAANANIIAGLAKSSLAQPAGTDRVKWVGRECNQRLRPSWETRKLKNAQQLSAEDVLRTPPRGVVNVFQVKDNSKPAFIEHAFATTVSPGGRKWIADQNQGYVPLTRAGLDACCVGEGTAFGGVVSGFTLTRGPSPADGPLAKKPRMLMA